MGRPERARKAVQLGPKPWEHWNTLSVAAYRAREWKTSLDARQEKLQRRPIAAEDRLFLAMTYRQLGNEAEGRKWYDEAIAEIAKEKAGSGRLVAQPASGGGATVRDNDFTASAERRQRAACEAQAKCRCKPMTP